MAKILYEVKQNKNDDSTAFGIKIEGILQKLGKPI